MRHTPGPWRLVKNLRGKMAIVGPRNDGETTDSDRICNLPYRKDGQGPANARLIVAAPDLLKAAEAALLFMPDGQPETRQLRDAVKKAGGLA